VQTLLRGKTHFTIKLKIVPTANKSASSTVSAAAEISEASDALEAIEHAESAEVFEAVLQEV
jgi:hypothetical protein